MRREILSRGGGLVSADMSTNGVGIVVAKFPQQPSGMTYEGMLVLVRDQTEYRVTVRFRETGVTGMRDAAIFAIHMNNAPDGADPTESWARDPYDGARRDRLMRNGADDEQYDIKFPDQESADERDHRAPLSRGVPPHDKAPVQAADESSELQRNPPDRRHGCSSPSEA